MVKVKLIICAVATLDISGAGQQMPRAAKSMTGLFG